MPMIRKKFIVKKNAGDEYILDQTCVLKKNQIPILYPLTPEVGELPKVTEWYPFCNSYYPFSEDVDAFSRVNHLLADPPQDHDLAAPLETGDFYDEREAQHHYLTSKPLSFLILGKPGLGQDDIGKKVADFWNCIYITPQSLLVEQIQSGGSMAECIEFNLRYGRAVGFETLLKLLQEKVKTPECQHRGFVISGFPLIANDLLEDELISSESALFNAKEVFDEIIDSTFVYHSKQNVSVRSEGSVDVMEDLLSTPKPLNLPETVEDSDDFEEYQKQIDSLFEVFHEPFILIYVVCENAEVINKRRQLFYDVDRDLIVHDPVAAYYGDLVKLPQHFEAHVATQLDRFHQVAYSLLESKILIHNIEYFIKVDGRASLAQIFDIIETRLAILPIQRVVMPRRFVEEFGETKFVDTLSTEEYIKKFSREQTVGRRFNYSLSPWNTKCPVKMKSSNVVEGSARYAVHFLNKLFLLSSEQALDSFMKNPRYYVEDSIVIPCSKCFIFGPPHCGKSNLSKCLEFLIHGTSIEYEDVKNDYITQLQAEGDDSVKQLALLEGLDILREQRENEARQKNLKRLEEINEWMADCREVLRGLLLLYVKDDTVTDVSSFPLRLLKTKSGEIIAKDVNYYNQLLKERNIPPVLDQENTEYLINNDEGLLQYAPLKLKTEIQPRMPEITDSWVLRYAEEKMKETLSIIELTPEDEKSIFNSLLNNLQQVDKCVVVDVPPKAEYLNQIPKELIPENVILLADTSVEFLIDKFRRRVKEDVDFRHFFLKLGKQMLAEHFSVGESDSYKMDVVKEILEEIVDGPTLSEDVVESYRKSVHNFNNEISVIKEFCEKNNSNLIEISLTNNSLNDVLWEVVSKLTDKYNNIARVYTEEDRAEEVKDFLDSLKESGLEDATDSDLFFKTRFYGDTRIYCPVAFHDKWVLWQGKDEFTAEFRNKIYLLSNKEALEDFIKSPRKYLPRNKPPTLIPPPRICVIGIEGCGKSSICKVLSENLGVQYIDYDEYISNTPIPVPLTDRENEILGEFGVEDEEQNVEDKASDIEPNLEQFVNLTWFNDPINCIGFVVEKFPKNLAHLEYMVHHQVIPDLIIQVDIDREVIVARLLKKYLAQWRKESVQKQFERQVEYLEKLVQYQEIRNEKFKELMNIKREERYLKSRQEVLEYITDGEDGEELDTISIDSVAEQEDMDEINRFLDGEYTEPVLEPMEGEKEATDRLIGMLESKYNESLEMFNNMKEICRTELIPWVNLDGNLHEDITKYNAIIVTQSLKSRNRSHFEMCFDVSWDVAERLLNLGYYFLSKFGKTCPVQYYKADNPFQMFLNNLDIYPVIHRSYIYYVSGKQNLEKFKSDPLRYTERDFKFPLIPFRIAIIGPPKSGKTCLADRYRRDLGLKLISRDEAVLYVLDSLQSSYLAQQVQHLLDMGWELTDDLVMKCVEAASFDPIAVTQGIVFDGFPSSLQELKIFTKMGMVPHLFFDLIANNDEIYDNTPIINIDDMDIQSKQLVQHWYQMWLQTAKDFRSYLHREYQNIVTVNIKKCLWGIWCNSLRISKDTFFEVKHYIVHVKKGWPVRLTTMLVTPLEFLERQSQYRSYCPGCLFQKVLRTGGNPPNRTGLLQYLRFFYWLCPQHVDDFLRYPEQYMRTDSLPSDLPKILSFIPQGKEVEMFCVVCYFKAIPKRGLVAGDSQFTLLYRDKVFLFDSKDCQDTFMCDPRLYSSIVVHLKQSVLTGQLSFEELPTLGFLEQFVAKQLAQAVNHTNSVRPLVPGLSIPVSAVISVGLHLKLHNPKTPRKAIRRFQEALNKFNERMGRLKFCLHQMKEQINPNLEYKRPTSDSMLSILDSILDKIEINEDGPVSYSGRDTNQSMLTESISGSAFGFRY